MIYWATWDKHKKLSQEEFFSCQCSMCDKNKNECLANAETMKELARRFGIGQWSFIGPGSEKKWYSAENSPQGASDHIAEEILLKFEESGHPTFRATTPLSRGILKSKERGKLSIHFAADRDTIDVIYRIILVSISSVFTEQWLPYVKRIWESSRWIGGTWDSDGSINCSRWNKGRDSFAEWKPIESSNSMATVHGTNWIAFTRKQSEWPGGWGPPKACSQQAAADSRGSRTCVCANTFSLGGGTRRGRRMNSHPAVVPSSRRGKNLQWDAKEEEPGCPQG